jgi:OFA family oxalate/formate antiporter-like MFS transporter
MTAIASWFKKRTSLAMGIGAAGAAAGGLLLPLYVWLIDTLGWRSTLEIFAVGSLVICFPLAFVVREPSDEAPQINPARKAGEPVTETRWEVVKEILKTRNFWLFSIAILLAGTTNSAIMAHQMPYIVSTGLTRETAGLLAVALSISNIIGRIGFGWLGDLMDKRYCFVIASIVQAGGLILFSYATNVAMFIPSIILVGLGLGGFMPLRAAMQMDFFGLRAFAMIQGLIVIFVTFSSIVSPPLAGWYYDVFNDYQPAWYTFAALSAAAVPVILATSIKNSRKL